MKFRLHYIAPLLVAIGLALSLGGHARAADYTQNHLIDDQVFNNVGTMNAAQIQSFLNAGDGRLSSPSTCLASYTTTNFFWDGNTWHYGDNSNGMGWSNSYGPATISAAQAIYQAAQMWGINPQVIISTLQKEESLVTGTSCDGWRYTSAMGYGCPDSGGCSSQYAGFTRQILWGSYQLEFGEQRSYGNIHWDGDETIKYYGYMTAGNRARCGAVGGACSSADTQLIFYDGNATIDGQTVTMTNGATASLYSYTPHVGQSFPGIFEGWFGSVITQVYAAGYVNQSNYPTIFQGQSASGSFTYKNTGNYTWYDDTTASANSAQPVHLATSDPINRHSDFGATWGANQNRPALTFAAVFNTSGTQYSTNPHAVLPGESAQFNFTITVPANKAPGIYREYFQPVVEGTINGSIADPGTYLDITVLVPVYSATFAGQSNYPTILAGNTASGSLSYRNSGNISWYDDTNANANGALPVHLASNHPINRNDPLGATWGANHNRPNMTFSAVYQSDGTTLASDQHTVAPGQIAKFNFTFTTTNATTPGNYREWFQPVLEGSANGAFNDPGTYIDVTVQAANYAAAFAGQSNYPATARNTTAAGFLKFKNVGNVAWYDDTSAGGAGVLPVHLATNHPINRASLFGATWGANQNRPTLNFTAVYEADGTTLAASQHIVQPGQIVQMSFTFTVPSFAVPMTYREWFQPVLEGSANGAFNDPGTYIEVTVTP